MPELKLLLIEKGDSQKNLVDKSNFNFSQIISFEGGPYGKLGPEGKSGDSGASGPVGSFGFQGERGNIWTISTSIPSSPLDGDYWMNPNLENQIRIYDSGSWDLYPLNINSLGIFRDFGPLETDSGISSKRGYFTSLPSPILNTIVLSDSNLSDGSIVANPQYSKLVISTDSGNPDRNILEFTKGDYQGSSFNSISPRFFWNPGATSTYGNYGLNFLSTGGIDINSSGDVYFKSVLGSINLSGGFLAPSLHLSEFYLNGTFNLNSYLEGSKISSNSGSGYILFDTTNFSFPTSTFGNFISSTTLNINTSGTTGSQPSLNIITGPTGMGNLYHKMPEIYPIDRSASTLFKATNSSNEILSISGRGDFKANKVIYPVQPKTVGGIISSGTIRYLVVDPTVALNGQSDAFSLNSSVGVDYYGDVPLFPGGLTKGISLWTPATGGSSYSSNGGWLNLLDSSEYFNFRVHMSNPGSGSTGGFRYIGINTSLTKNSPPGTGTQIKDLGSGNYCHSVEFTIMNISSTAGGTGGTDRWFKVLYQAYGGNLSTPVCGDLYTNGSTP